MHFNTPSLLLRKYPLLYLAPLPAVVYFATMSTPPHPTASRSSNFPARPYISRHQEFPYKPSDFKREDESEDEGFYSAPRFVTHIDDHAISVLKRYYATVLPQRGKILDLCSSWISHFPQELEEKARADSTVSHDGEDTRLEVVGLGMNQRELDANPILSKQLLQNLNKDPSLPEGVRSLDATVCVVSIDYLTSPVAVLKSIREATRIGGRVHLVVSNRCFPTKAVARWLRVGEQERLDMVGEYLWWSGWREVEIVELSDGTAKEGEEAGGMGGGLGDFLDRLGMGSGRVDPLWVVRGVKMDESEA